MPAGPGPGTPPAQGFLCRHPQEGKNLACKILCPDTLSLLAKETFIFVASLGVGDTEAADRKDKKWSPVSQSWNFGF